MKKLISIIIPCYNEEENILPFYKEIDKVSKQLKKYSFEFIYVIDPGSDNSNEVVKKLNNKDSRVKYIIMARRFGKEASMLAGLKRAKGDFVTIMDVDLQDPPEILKDMIKYLETGKYDSVAARRINRKGEAKIRSFFSNLFYKVMQKHSNLDLKPGDRDYRLMTRRMVDKVLQSNEKNRFLKAIYGYTGFNTKWIEFENVTRNKGKTKWSFFNLFKYSLTCIYGFTNLPLLIITYLGIFLLVLSLIGFIVLLVLGINSIKYNNIILITNIIMFFESIQILCLSVVSHYLYSIFIEVKDKPLYIIMETEEEVE